LGRAGVGPQHAANKGHGGEDHRGDGKNNEGDLPALHKANNEPGGGHGDTVAHKANPLAHRITNQGHITKKKEEEEEEKKEKQTNKQTKS